MNKKIKLNLLNIGLLIISLSTSVLLTELLFRYYSIRQFKKQIREFNHDLFILEPDSPLEFSLKPNAKRTNSFPSGTQWIYTINSQGFRGKDISVQHNGTKRIVFLGDSYTFGWGINDNEIYTERLELLLNHLNNKERFQVINLAVPAYNTVQEYHLLKKKMRLYKPNTVVLAYVMDDAEPYGDIPRNPKNSFKYAKLWIWDFLKDSLNENLFQHKEVFTTSIQKHNFNYLEGFKFSSHKWRESKEALSKIASFCNEGGVNLMVVIFPDFSEHLDSSYRNTTIHKKVAQWCNEFHINYIDLLPYFQNIDSWKLHLKDDFHPNAQTHQKIAEILVAPILNLQKDNLP